MKKLLLALLLTTAAIPAQTGAWTAIGSDVSCLLLSDDDNVGLISGTASGVSVSFRPEEKVFDYGPLSFDFENDFVVFPEDWMHGRLAMGNAYIYKFSHGDPTLNKFISALARNSTMRIQFSRKLRPTVSLKGSSAAIQQWKECLNNL